MAQPVRYSPDVEAPKDDENSTICQLEEQFRQIQKTTSQDYQHAVRAVHAEAHGIARGTLTVKAGLPPELAQDLFAQPGTYEAFARISTNPGDILNDFISVPRGFSLKVLGVEGERLAGSEGDTTQDFIMVNGPAFAAPDAASFLGNLKMLARTADKGEGAKTALSATLQTLNSALSAAGLGSPTIQ